MVLFQAQLFGIGTRYDLEILRQFGERFKTKSQVGFGLIAMLIEVTGEK